MFAALTDTLLEKTLLLLVATILVTYGTYLYSLAQGWTQKIQGKYVWALFLVPFVLIFAVSLAPWPYSLLGLLAFGAIFGVELALILPSYSEEIVKNALSLTALITITVGYFGFTTTNDLSFLGPILFVLLIGLIVWNVIVLRRRIEGHTGKLVRTVLGSLLFTVYLIYDFNRLAQVSNYEGAAENWQLATQFALTIYIDVINLLLYLLQLLDR